MKRRDFFKTSGLIGLSTALPTSIIGAPEVFTKSRAIKQSAGGGELIFEPVMVQKGRGPNLYPLAWTTDKDWDTFYSDIEIKDNIIKVIDTKDEKKFGINVRWNVEGFGYTNITADNGGNFYEVPPFGKSKTLLLNYEFALSRVARNKKRFSKFLSDGWLPSKELRTYFSLSEELLEDSEKKRNDKEKCAELSQKSLMYAMWAGEILELEKANFDIAKMGTREGFFFGCDARSFYQMYQDTFLDRFSEVFNFANITFVAKGDGMMSDYQSSQGVINPESRELLIKKLAERNIKSQERLLFWFHDCCIPDWLRNMKYDELLKYAEKLTTDTMKRFGDSLYAMEVVNEIHDWANELLLTPEQITELTRLINDTAKSISPNVKRTVNNCCPFAEYVQMKSYSGKKATMKQRSPYKFSKDLIEAGIDFDILEQQMYYPYRDLQDSIIIMENLASLGKPMQISEIGVSGGPTNETIKTGKAEMPNEPPLWHRYWDEQTQADWLEDTYTLYYSKPFIKAINWFDLIDPGSFMQNGGILRTVKGEKKEAFHRLQKLQNRLGHKIG